MGILSLTRGSFPYLWGVIKGKSAQGVDYPLINEYNIRERDGG